MKVVIMAGGYGTRLSEETDLKPKPMVEIGGKPILWHIMKIYEHYGYSEFVILLGYKGYIIKEYFTNYFLHQSDITVDLSNNSVSYHDKRAEKWKVTLLDTGIESLTGGRILRAKAFIGNEPFMLTYGDGVADVNIANLVDFHKAHGRIATMTTVLPDGRFGSVAVSEDNEIFQFVEKPRGTESWVNGGFFVCEPAIFDYLTQGDSTVFELDPLAKLASEGQLMAYKHDGFWKAMDTLRDKSVLNEMWSNESPKWKVWK
jgi:glucose-1-phosphate cytidylyltransferase